MRYRICRFSISTAIVPRLISFLIILWIGLPATGQQRYQNPTPKRDQKNKKKEVAAADTIPLYNGIYMGVDLYGMGAKLLGSDFISSEISVNINLKNKFIPAFEFGMGATDTWNETGIHYKNKPSPFFRIGIDYNTMAKKADKSSFLYAGFRYAFSSFKYDVSSMPVDDPIWGDELPNPTLEDEIWGGSAPFDYQGMKGSMQWLEFVLGVNVRIYRNFHMGWTLRMKYKTTVSFEENGNPWYIPGYGKYKSNNMGITYSLIYKLPF